MFECLKTVFVVAAENECAARHLVCTHSKLPIGTTYQISKILSIYLRVMGETLEVFNFIGVPCEKKKIVEETERVLLCFGISFRLAHGSCELARSRALYNSRQYIGDLDCARVLKIKLINNFNYMQMNDMHLTNEFTYGAYAPLTRAVEIYIFHLSRVCVCVCNVCSI